MAVTARKENPHKLNNQVVILVVGSIAQYNSKADVLVYRYRGSLMTPTLLVPFIYLAVYSDDLYLRRRSQLIPNVWMTDMVVVMMRQTISFIAAWRTRGIFIT